MSGLAPLAPDDGDEAVTVVAADGWVISATMRSADSEHADGARGVVLVHGSKHARDTFVYARALPAVLARRGLASIRFDIRGRGESQQPRRWAELSVDERRDVRLDVAAAAQALRDRFGVAPDALGVVGEQDTATAVVAAIAADEGIRALALLSPRLDRRSLEELACRRLPTLAWVSKEDRRALRDAVAAYVNGDPASSTLEVFTGLGFGATMFMARAFEQPTEPALEDLLAEWFDRVL